MLRNHLNYNWRSLDYPDEIQQEFRIPLVINPEAMWSRMRTIPNDRKETEFSLALKAGGSTIPEGVTKPGERRKGP
jgi:hypothetical protein